MSLQEVEEEEAGTDSGLLDLHVALNALAAHSKEHARIVELRQFGGLSQGEVAEFLGTSPATVARRWRVAKAWLYPIPAGQGAEPTLNPVSCDGPGPIWNWLTGSGLF